MREVVNPGAPHNCTLYPRSQAARKFVQTQGLELALKRIERRNRWSVVSVNRFGTKYVRT